jgi:hypothetical protein
MQSRFAGGSPAQLLDNSGRDGWPTIVEIGSDAHPASLHGVLIDGAVTVVIDAVLLPAM